MTDFAHPISCGGLVGGGGDGFEESCELGSGSRFAERIEGEEMREQEVEEAFDL